MKVLKVCSWKSQSEYYRVQKNCKFVEESGAEVNKDKRTNLGATHAICCIYAEEKIMSLVGVFIKSRLRTHFSIIISLFFALSKFIALVRFRASFGCITHLCRTLDCNTSLYVVLYAKSVYFSREDRKAFHAN